MSEAWAEHELGDVLTFQRGFDITKKQQEPGSYPVISSSGPMSSHGEYKVKGPGVVIGRKGTLGTVFYSEHHFWPHDTTLWVNNFHGNDERFAYYFLKTLHLEQYDCGASNPTINRNHIHKLRVRIPSISTQRVIATILTAYDDLIENNTQRIKILEQMAQMLYHEWFVHFRFPGHEHVRLVDSSLSGASDK
jgi:type I restriction enzyme S subunit